MSPACAATPSAVFIRRGHRRATRSESLRFRCANRRGRPERRRRTMDRPRRASLVYPVIGLAAVVAACTVENAPQRASGGAPTALEFKGVIKLDVRDSKPDWTPFTP